MIKTHCPSGHEYSEENTYTDKNGYKHCRTCARERMRDNRSDGPGRGNKNKAKTHCPYGHEYTKENTYINPQGRRTCKICATKNNKAQVIKKYGISVREFEILLKQQNNHCAICLKEFKSDKDRHIDHDHRCCSSPDRTCGKCVRGILCGECNRGLARFFDDSNLLRKAADYLDNRK